MQATVEHIASQNPNARNAIELLAAGLKDPIRIHEKACNDYILE